MSSRARVSLLYFFFIFSFITKIIVVDDVVVVGITIFCHNIAIREKETKSERETGNSRCYTDLTVIPYGVSICHINL